jgi:hypothetical protein
MLLAGALLGVFSVRAEPGPPPAPTPVTAPPAAAPPSAEQKRKAKRDLADAVCRGEAATSLPNRV